MDNNEVAGNESRVGSLKVIPAIYVKSMHDHYFHASMSCRAGEKRITERYRVNTVQFVINQGKYPCSECWVSDGYDAINDVVAARG